MKVVLCGYYGFGNGGDEALLAVLLQFLPEDVTPIVLSANVERTETLHQVKAIDRRKWGLVLQTIRAADGFVWGGGSLMQDATSFASPIYYGGLMLWAQLSGSKTVAWAQGIGPLIRPWTRWFTAWLMGRCTQVTVRDGQSATWLRTRHIPYHQAPDPVWALTETPVPGYEHLPANRVAVSLRPHSSLTQAGLLLLTEALVEFQKATGVFIVLLPFQKSKDLPIATLLQANLPKVSQIIFLENPRELKAMFASVQMTIGMRLHALIMAAAAGSKCFALSYDPKVQVLAAEFQFPVWQLPKLPETAAEITQAWLALYSHGQPLPPERITHICQAAATQAKALQDWS